MSKSTMELPAPRLEGLRWRGVSGDDLAALVLLAAECYGVDGGIAFLNEPENVARRYYRDAPGAGVGAFTADEQLVACATVHVAREADTERALIAGQVAPQWRNRGIGDYLMRWSEVQAQALFTGAGVERRLHQIATETLTEPARRLYGAHGFGAVMEELVMRRDLRLPLPERPLPPSVTLASWEPAVGEQFYEAYSASFRDRPGFPGWSADEWIGWTADDNLRAEWSLLARVDGAPAGFVTAGVEHVDSFIMQVGVVPEQRRRGLASALMVEAMGRMRADGERGTELTVNVNNPGAIEAYEGLGFVTKGRRGRFERVVG